MNNPTYDSLPLALNRYNTMVARETTLATVPALLPNAAWFGLHMRLIHAAIQAGVRGDDLQFVADVANNALYRSGTTITPWTPTRT